MSNNVLKGLAGKLLKGTVYIIITKNDGGTASGSGFIVDKGDFVITAMHNLENAKRISIFPINGSINDERICKDGDWSTGAQIQLKKDKQEIPYYNLDVSVIHLNESFDESKSLEIDEKPAIAGQDVLFSGYPSGGMRINTKTDFHPPYPLVSRAMIAGSARIGIDVVEYCYWLDKPSFGGNSGGPVMNIESKKIIGVISSTPYMPSKIRLEDDSIIPVSTPNGFAETCGISLLPRIIDDYKKNKPWLMNS
jgi:V8-like Glu-specific endopeptidase